MCVALRDYPWLLVEALALVVLAFALSGCGRNGVATPSSGSYRPPTTAEQKLLAEMYEKHIAVLQDKGNLPQRDLKDWLSKQSSSWASGDQRRRDLESWRDALLSFLESPGIGFTRGERSWEPMKKAMAVLADFEFNGQTASAAGFPAISESVDVLLEMAKGIVLVQAEQNPKPLETVRKPVRSFVEYFYIFNVLAGAKERNPIAQAALLSMRAADGEAEQAQLLALHQALLSLSRAHPTKGDPQDPNISQALRALVSTMTNLGITDAELDKAGGQKLVRMTSGLRDMQKMSK